MNLNYASRFVAKEGESCCGDAVFARVGVGTALFVLIDVLGHGPNAYRVAELALRMLERLPADTTAIAAIEALHQTLHGTRGAVATALSVQQNEAELCGVGNIGCRCLGFRCPFVAAPGVLGLQSPRRINTRFKLVAGQGVLLHSDGISHRVEPDRLIDLTPPAMCEYLLSNHRYSHDDASVIVVRAEEAARSRA